MEDNTTTVKVDSDIPVPPQREEYPFLEMEVGDSFEVKLAKRESVQTIASGIKRTTGKRFTVRKVDSDTCRVWRVK